MIGSSRLEIELADHAAGLCTAANVKYVGGRSLFLSLPMPEAEIRVGALSFHHSSTFETGSALLVETFGDDCSGGWTNAQGDSGTVTITEVTETHVKGTFSVIMFGNGEHVDGRFDAARCDSSADVAAMVCKK